MVHAGIIVSALLVFIDLITHISKFKTHHHDTESLLVFSYVLGYLGGIVGRVAAIYYLYQYSMTL